MSTILLLAGLLVGCRDALSGNAPAPLPTLVETAPTVPPYQPTPTLAPFVPTIPPPTVPPQLLTAGDPYIPQLGNGGYDVARYLLRLGLDPAVRQVNGAVRIEGVTTQSLSLLAFDFVGFRVTAVQFNSIPVTYARQNDKLLLTLPRAMPAGSAFVIDVAYSGAPAVRPSPYVGFVPSLGLQYVDDTLLYALGEPDGSRFWFPCNDHPRDKAQFRFEISAPAGLTAVANGTRRDETAAGMPLPSGAAAQTVVWEHPYPMAPYLATVAVGPFTRLDRTSPAGIPIRHYVLDSAAEEFARVDQVTGEAIDWLSARLGPYPFETIGFVTVPIPGLSLETQTLILMSTGAIGLRTAVHELAHMWLGDSVSLDSWGPMWLKEGLATYMQLLWEYRDDPEGLALEMAALETAVAENGDTFPLNEPPPAKLFGFHVYIQGAVLAHALRLEVGDEAFFAGLQAYAAAYGGGTAGPVEFQAALEGAAGRPLGDFFTTWLAAGG